MKKLVRECILSGIECSALSIIGFGLIKEFTPTYQLQNLRKDNCEDRIPVENLPEGKSLGGMKIGICDYTKTMKENSTILREVITSYSELADTFEPTKKILREKQNTLNIKLVEDSEDSLYDKTKSVLASVNSFGREMVISIPNIQMLNQSGIKALLVHETDHIRQFYKYKINQSERLDRTLPDKSLGFAAPNILEYEAEKAANKYRKSQKMSESTGYGETPRGEFKLMEAE